MSIIGSSAILAASSAAFGFSLICRWRGFRPRHRRVHIGQVVRVLGVGHLLEQLLRVLALVQAVRFGCDHDRVHAGRRLGAAWRVAE